MNLGRHKARVECAVVETLEDGREIGRVTFVVTTVTGEEEGIDGTVWFTEKALGIAYARFRSIGFDIKTRDLAELNKNPFLLKGNTCEIEVGEFNGRPQVQWFGQPKVPVKPSALAALTKKIRAVVGDEKTAAIEEHFAPPVAPAETEHPADVENKAPRF